MKESIKKRDIPLYLTYLIVGIATIVLFALIFAFVSTPLVTCNVKCNYTEGGTQFSEPFISKSFSIAELLGSYYGGRNSDASKWTFDISSIGGDTATLFIRNHQLVIYSIYAVGVAILGMVAALIISLILFLTNKRYANLSLGFSITGGLAGILGLIIFILGSTSVTLADIQNSATITIGDITYAFIGTMSRNPTFFIIMILIIISNFLCILFSSMTKPVIEAKTAQIL